MDPYEDTRRRMAYFLVKALNQFGRKHIGAPLNIIALAQMSVDQRQLLMEILGFGFDVWPTDAERELSTTEFAINFLHHTM